MKGEKGSNESPGLTGPKGAPGENGTSVTGDGEERNRGTVYVRWGHDSVHQLHN